MTIKQIRIRNIWNYLFPFEENEEFYIGLRYSDKHFEKLKKIGFSVNLLDGEQILPLSIGSISEYNAEGKFKILRDLPMETVTRQALWKWKDWGGYEHSKIVDIPYKRYPREYIEAPSEELHIVSFNNEKLVISRVFQKDYEKEEEIKHLINLYLEIFGECELLKSNLAPPFTPQAIRLNWTILPNGEFPWEREVSEIKEIIRRQPIGNQPVIKFRLKTIENFNPDFFAYGNAGFSGYLVYGFCNKGIYILECIRTGNATYVFDENWEYLSQLTKKEILSNALQKARFIHKVGWENEIRNLLK